VRLMFVLVLAWLPGCAPSIAHYEWTTEKAALEELARRAALVKTVEASCVIAMHDQNDRYVTLDGAMVARNPGEFRLRAWKLQHPAFDITVVPDGVWIDAANNHNFDQAELGKNITKAWSMFAGEFLQGDLTIDRVRSDRDRIVLFDTKRPNDLTTLCIVERSTLTPMRYETIGMDGSPRYAIRLEKYRQFEEIVWPQRIIFESQTRRIAIDIQDIEFNGEPKPAAFKPPRHAVRLP
jgi:hypothetical protein